MPPLVSIGIPTYGRAVSLQRAVESALGQQDADVEVIVSDDASPDDTEDRMRELAAREPRLRYVRKPVNGGHAANFADVFELARGEYFMWLADDDWLDERYVTRCRDELERDPGLALVTGRALLSRGDGEPMLERPENLDAASPAVRVWRHFAVVSTNGALYGLMRREDLAAYRFRPVLGDDWLLVAAMAARGRVRTLEDVHVHRSATGISDDSGERLMREFGLTGWRADHPHAAVAATIVRDVAAGGHPAFRVIPAPLRWAAGLASAATVAVRFGTVRLLRRLGLFGAVMAITRPLRERRHR